jgi:hypothetical protein
MLSEMVVTLFRVGIFVRSGISYELWCIVDRSLVFTLVKSAVLGKTSA